MKFGEKPPGLREVRSCENCGAPFWAEVRPNKGRFCSRSCRSQIIGKATAGKKPLIERFWPKVKMALNSDGCWEWQGSRRYGYGYLMMTKHEIKAHRVSWELHFGPIPDGFDVLHKCDNPPCVRPDHLFLGTQSDNAKDMWAKGRAWHQKQAAAS